VSAASRRPDCGARSCLPIRKPRRAAVVLTGSCPSAVVDQHVLLYCRSRSLPPGVLMMRSMISLLLAVAMATAFATPVLAGGGKVNNPGTFGGGYPAPPPTPNPQAPGK